jgi:hypothetical protein
MWRANRNEADYPLSFTPGELLPCPTLEYDRIVQKCSHLFTPFASSEAVVKANRILDLGELLVQQGPYKAIPMGMAPGSLLSRLLLNVVVADRVIELHKRAWPPA